MKELYQIIAAALNNIEGIKTVAVWNNQVNSESKELALFLPAIYFSANVRWMSMSTGVRKGEGTLKVYIVTELYETKHDEISDVTAYMDIVDRVYQVLSKAGFMSISDDPDTNHDNVPVHISTFKFDFTDEQMKGTNKAGRKLVKVIPEIIIEK